MQKGGGGSGDWKRSRWCSTLTTLSSNLLIAVIISPVVLKKTLNGKFSE